MSENGNYPQLSDYSSQTSDTIRYCDTDRQGHVNNSAFAMFCETGRVNFLYDPERPLCQPGTAFVIAKLSLEFRSELTWPGKVDIGTRVERIGRSSLNLSQALFQEGRLAAVAETVIVLMDESTRKSTPLSEQAVEVLRGLQDGV